jgi:hypothetical protein
LALQLHAAGFCQVEQTGYKESPVAELILESASMLRVTFSLCINAVK